MVEATVIRSRRGGGSSISWGASTFELGPAGQPNAVSAIGQTILLTNARASSLQLLASAVNGCSERDLHGQLQRRDVNEFHPVRQRLGKRLRRAGRDDRGDDDLQEPSTSRVATAGTCGRCTCTDTASPWTRAKPMVSVTLPNSPNIKILAMDLVSTTRPGQSWEQLQPGRPDKRYGNHFGQP